MHCALVGWTSRSNDVPSELAVVLQIAMDLHHVVELECAIDDRLERAALQAFEDKFHRGLPECFVAGRDPDVEPLMTGILAIIASTGIGVSPSASAPVMRTVLP